jgi:hypothetical protein
MNKNNCIVINTNKPDTKKYEKKGMVQGWLYGWWVVEGGYVGGGVVAGWLQGGYVGGGGGWGVVGGGNG